MNAQDVQLVDLLKHMHAMCSVRGDDLQKLIPTLAHQALDAGYWSEAFRVFLYNKDASIEDMRVSLESHIESLGGIIDVDKETSDLIEATYYLQKLLQPGENILSVAHYLLVELDDWELQGGPPHLHISDLAMEYYIWRFDFAEWMDGEEYEAKKAETETNVKRLAQRWLDQYAIANPFHRL